MDKSALVSVAIPILINASPITCQKARHLISSYNEMYMVPNVSDFLERKPIERLYILKPTSIQILQYLNKHGGISQGLTEKYIEKIAEQVVLTVCANDSKEWDGFFEYQYLSWVFLGSCVPTLSNYKTIFVQTWLGG